MLLFVTEIIYESRLDLEKTLPESGEFFRENNSRPLAFAEF